MKSSVGLRLWSYLLLVNAVSVLVVGFAPSSPAAFVRRSTSVRADESIFVAVVTTSRSRLYSMPPGGGDGPLITVLGDDEDDDGEEEEDEDDDDDDEEMEDDPYTSLALDEFEEMPESSSALTTMTGELATMADWGGALGKLRQRVEDIESGASQDPSHALFRLMSSETPNQIIGKFVNSANPQTVQAMSGAVSSLLGGLSSPQMGVETLVKASGEKIGSLCFQLQMTGYLFRNAEYVLALKDLLKLKGNTSFQDYKDAFERLDIDGSGYIESTDIRELFDDVYEDKAPQVEIDAFLQFFDQNNDGRISWNEFEQGLGAAVATQRDKGEAGAALLGVDMEDDDVDEDDDDNDDNNEDDEPIDISADVSGTIEIEFEDGNVVEVDAEDYLKSLKNEARMLKEALRKEAQEDGPRGKIPSEMLPNGMGVASSANKSSMDITQYIASRQGDVKSLTEGISPEIVETMKGLVDFVLEGGDNVKGKKKMTPEQRAGMEMEIPGGALQQLALWQLVLGYRLREEEATGDYKKLLQ